jgi:hypothetical protein
MHQARFVVHAFVGVRSWRRRRREARIKGVGEVCVRRRLDDGFREAI